MTYRGFTQVRGSRSDRRHLVRGGRDQMGMPDIQHDAGIERTNYATT